MSKDTRNELLKILGMIIILALLIWGIAFINSKIDEADANENNTTLETQESGNETTEEQSESEQEDSSNDEETENNENTNSSEEKNESEEENK